MAKVSMHKTKAEEIIDDPVKPDESLSRRVIISGFWVFSLRVFQQLFSFSRLIILARILAPFDFGLMGIALLTMSTLETFSQTGFQAALIQKKKDIESYLDAAWTVLILRGLAIFGILYFAAPFASSFFAAPEAKPIIRVIGFSVLLQAFTNIGVIYFQKELKFNKEFIYQFVGTIADFVVAVAAVLILKSVWALVFGLLSGNAARCFVSYLLQPYRAHLSFDLRKAKELFGFGKWILGSSILVFLLTQGDDAFVARILGTAALGFYQLAYRISNMPATEISHVISKVMYPAYSEIRDNLPALRESYLKVLELTAFLSFPATAVILVLSPDFTNIFLGDKWLPMVPAMQVLALFGMIRSIGATTGVVFMAVGKPEIRTKIQSAQLIFLAVLIYPLTMRWGILGTSIAVTAYALIFNLVAFYKALDIVKSDIKKPARVVAVPAIGTLIMICTVLAVRMYIIPNVCMASFFSLIGCAVSAYLFCVYLSNLIINDGNKLAIQIQIGDFFQKDNDK